MTLLKKTANAKSLIWAAVILLHTCIMGQTTYFVTVIKASGDGYCTVSGAGNYSLNEKVTLHAAFDANSDYIFSRWSDNGQYNYLMDYEITVTGEREVYAYFIQKSICQVNYNMNYQNGGTIVATGISSSGSTVTPGTSISLTATANSGYTFLHWQNNYDQYTSATIDLTVSESMNLVAVFQGESHRVQASVNPPNSGFVQGGGDVPYMSSVDLEAIAYPGYKFVNWTENGQVLGSSNKLTIIPETDREDIVANFEPLETIWIKSGDNIYFIGGNVGIGTETPDPAALLTVKGKFSAEEVVVQLIDGQQQPDYVFEEDYDLISLEEIESFIEEHKHLPEIPSAKEVEQNGMNSGEMQTLLLKKIEEMTLYVIEMKKENTRLLKKIEELQKK